MGCKTSPRAIAEAEALVDYTEMKESNKPRDKRDTNKDSGWVYGNQKTNDGARKPPTERTHNGGKNQRAPKTNCFLCDGPYWARECPKRKALNALTAEYEE